MKIVLFLFFLPPLLNYFTSFIKFRYLRGVFYTLSSLIYFLLFLFIIGNESDSLLQVKDIFNNISISFKFDDFARLYLFVASILYPIATVYGICYFNFFKKDDSKFHILSATSVGFSILIIAATNLFISFIFYELLTLVTYFLIVYHRNYHSVKNGYKYLIILSFTSFFFFIPGILYLYNITENLDFKKFGILKDLPVSSYFVNFTFSLILIGIGKNTLLPFNIWMIFAMVAPVPVSSLLHSVLVVKVGVLLSMKIIYQIYNLDLLKEHLYKFADIQWIYLLPMATIIYAGLNAITSDNIKKRLAYSTISQISYILLISLLSKHLSFKYIIMHSLAKINLFFFAGYLYMFYNVSHISEIKRFHLNYFIRFSIFLSILSLIGIGPTAGLSLKEKIFEHVLYGISYQNLVLFLFFILSSFLTCFYMKPLLDFIRQENKRHDMTRVQHSTTNTAMTAIMTINALLIIVLFFKFDLLVAYLKLN